MLAEEFLRKHIYGAILAKASVIAFCNEGKDWYHVHRDEEVPEGHLRIVFPKGSVDIYNTGNDRFVRVPKSGMGGE